MSGAKEALLQLQALADAIRRSSPMPVADEAAFRRAATANPELYELAKPAIEERREGG